MKTVEKFIQKHLNKLGYIQVSKCKNDMVNTLKMYKCLGKLIITLPSIRFVINK